MTYPSSWSAGFAALGRYLLLLFKPDYQRAQRNRKWVEIAIVEQGAREPSACVAQIGIPPTYSTGRLRDRVTTPITPEKIAAFVETMRLNV